MGGEVGLADVRLDLDDPTDSAGPGAAATASGVWKVADEMRAEQRACGVERRAGEDGPVEDRQTGRLTCRCRTLAIRSA
jgi:hypothetical protein